MPLPSTKSHLMTRTLTFLCISTYFKGNDFLQALKDAGNKVFLITAKKLEDKPWVRDAVDEFFMWRRAKMVLIT